jgi:hypothetical protein
LNSIKHTFHALLMLTLTACSDANTTSSSDKPESTKQAVSAKVKVKAPKSTLKQIIKTTTGAIATSVVAAFVYDAINPSSINQTSNTLDADYPFFAIDSQNNRTPLEAGSYQIAQRKANLLTIVGNNNQVYIVTIGNDSDFN